jgi:hypothetical protein
MVRLHSPTNSPITPTQSHDMPLKASDQGVRYLQPSTAYPTGAGKDRKCQIQALGRGRPWPLEAGLPPPVSRSETQSLGTCDELTSQMPYSITVADQKSLASGAVGYASSVNIDSSVVGRVVRYVVL